MALHESVVNYANLIRDLAEMYPFDVCEVVVSELIANSLDARADRVAISYDPNKRLLVFEDNGTGMTASQFEEYHDFAAGLKTRGSGIGFAGVGAKISFNIANRVVTETRSESFSGGSNWYLHDNKRLLWEEIKPERLCGQGTRVEVWFREDAAVPYSSTDDLIRLLRRHYLPLMDVTFLKLYGDLTLYSRDFRFVVNGQEVEPVDLKEDLVLTKTHQFCPKRRGKRCGLGVLGLSEHEYPLAPDVCGVLVCTHGKVIKPDMFNQFPGNLGPRLFGLVEIPALAMFLTTSKTDFARKGKLKEFESLYDPVRQEFAAWLRGLGIETPEVAGTNEARSLEREIKRMLPDIPEFQDFFGFRRKKDVLVPDPVGDVSATPHEGADKTFPIGNGTSSRKPGPVDIGGEPGVAFVESRNGTERARPISRRVPEGPRITFLSAPERLDLAWVDGSKIVINSSHPSYQCTGSNARARQVHNILAIGSALWRFLDSGGEKPDPLIIDRVMASWGKRAKK